MSEMTTSHDLGSAHRHGSLVWPLVLIALSAVMLRRWQDGLLPLYVHPGFVPFLVLTAVGLIGLAAAQLWARIKAADGIASGRLMSWGLALVSIAVLIAALVPARPLGSAVAAVQASQSGGLPPSALVSLTDETASWTLLEWSQALNGGVRRERLIGRPVSVVGFVYRARQNQPPGELLVTRFVVRCCAADGMAVSLPVRHAAADGLAADTWVQVDGILRIADGPGEPYPFVEADHLTVVPPPPTPYLSPA